MFQASCKSAWYRTAHAAAVAALVFSGSLATASPAIAEGTECIVATDAEFEAAITNSICQAIRLNADLTAESGALVRGPLVVNRDLVLDLAGYSLDIDTDAEYGLDIVGGVNFRMQGSEQSRITAVQWRAANPGVVASYRVNLGQGYSDYQVGIAAASAASDVPIWQYPNVAATGLTATLANGILTIPAGLAPGATYMVAIGQQDGVTALAETGVQTLVLIDVSGTAAADQNSYIAPTPPQAEETLAFTSTPQEMAAATTVETPQASAWDEDPVGEFTYGLAEEPVPSQTEAVPEAVPAQAVPQALSAMGRSSLATTSEPQPFDSTSAPTISGTTKVGETLSADVIAWSPAAIFTYQWLRDGSVIDGATQKTYTLTAADAGREISVQITGTADNRASQDVTSAPTPAVAIGEFTTVVPKIVGNAKLGQTLSAVPGTWSPNPEFTYQWLRDGLEIPGETGPEYTLTAADLGTREPTQITVRVTGTKSGYTTTDKISLAKIVEAGAFTTTSAPTISGTAKVGETLTAKVTAWTPATEFSYQWLADGAAISGATNETYKLTIGDAGKKITVQVTSKLAGYDATSKTSAETGVVATIPFTSTSAPTISGTAKVGETLKATVSAWTPATDFSYQWLADGTAISGATSDSYVLKGADAGKKITVEVTSKLAGYDATSTTSAETKAESAELAFTTAPTPTISGTLVVGQTLTANPGTWSPTPTKLAYQWFRGTTAIPSATNATYTLTTADVGSQMSVKVTATLAGYTTTERSSGLTVGKVTDPWDTSDGSYNFAGNSGATGGGDGSSSSSTSGSSTSGSSTNSTGNSSSSTTGSSTSGTTGTSSTSGTSTSGSSTSSLSSLTSTPTTSASASAAATVTYANCAAVKAAGKAPLIKGQPGYAASLDADGDGIACEDGETGTSATPTASPSPSASATLPADAVSNVLATPTTSDPLARTGTEQGSALDLFGGNPAAAAGATANATPASFTSSAPASAQTRSLKPTTGVGAAMENPKVLASSVAFSLATAAAAAWAIKTANPELGDNNLFDGFDGFDELNGTENPEGAEHLEGTENEDPMSFLDEPAEDVVAAV